MRLLVTGAGGQVGRELMRVSRPRDASVVGLARSDLDVADAAAVERVVAAERPTVIVNAAAYTAVDRAESEADAAHRINAEAPRHLAEACARHGAALLHISTDYVFDGTKATPYREDDPVAPLGVYGATKEAGERAVRQVLDRHVILRTSWVYAAHGHNFVKTMLRLGRERDSLNVVDDQVGAPTAAVDIARAIMAIAPRLAEASPAWGTYHYTARGRTSWHGFAEAIFDRAAAALGRRPVVHAIPTSAYPTPARRPANSQLDCACIDAAFAPPRRDWQAGLEEVLGELLAAGGVSG